MKVMVYKLMEELQPKKVAYEEEEKVLKYIEKKFRMSHNTGESFSTKDLFQ